MIKQIKLAGNYFQKTGRNSWVSYPIVKNSFHQLDNIGVDYIHTIDNNRSVITFSTPDQENIAYLYFGVNFY